MQISFDLFFMGYSSRKLKNYHFFTIWLWNQDQLKFIKLFELSSQTSYVVLDFIARLFSVQINNGKTWRLHWLLCEYKHIIFLMTTLMPSKIVANHFFHIWLSDWLNAELKICISPLNFMDVFDASDRWSYWIVINITMWLVKIRLICCARAVLTLNFVMKNIWNSKHKRWKII